MTVREHRRGLLFDLAMDRRIRSVDVAEREKEAVMIFLRPLWYLWEFEPGG